MKLELKLTNDWLEATWYTEVDGVKTQVHCESFSGHPEHIAMLRSKLAEYGTETTVEDETMIAECITNFVMPTEAELAQQAVDKKIAEAKAYLASTDFKMTVDYYSTMTPEQQEELTRKRAEARSFLREQGL